MKTPGLPRYTKPVLSHTQQIAQLKARGLEIANSTTAENCLKHIGYYRLAGFSLMFQNDPLRHTFTPGTKLEDIVSVYNFDRGLRLLIYDSIERIEIAFRSLLVDRMSAAYGDRWFMDKSLFYDESYYINMVKLIDDEICRSKEIFITHHFGAYDNTVLPPAWKTLQVLSLGTLSKLYRNLRKNLPEKQTIALDFGLPTHTLLESWMQTVCVMRNLCAHHSRITYKQFPVAPMKLNYSPHRNWIANSNSNTNPRLMYTQIAVVKYMLNRINPGNHFTIKLQTLFAECPIVNPVRLGFYPNWENEPVWRG